MAEPSTRTTASAIDWIMGQLSLPVQQAPFERLINVCRILLGLGMLHRYADILGFVVIANDPMHATTHAVYAGLLSLALCLGVVTPLALLGVMFYTLYTPFGFTLGDQMVLLACWALLFGGAGRRYGVDAWLVQQPGAQRVARLLYGFAVPFGPQSVAGLRLLILLLYASISFGALAFHFNDELWLDGNVLQVLSTMPYMTDYAASATKFRDAFPVGYNFLCTAGLAVQCVFELLMLPLCLWRWGRVFVAVQWLGFIVLRAVQMNLGYLCYTELVLWLLVFGHAPLKNVLRGVTVAPWPTDGARLRDTRAGRTLGGFLMAAAAVVLYFNVVNTARINWAGSALARLPYAPLTFRLFAQWPVNVFNDEDLALGNAQLVLCETDASGAVLRTVPYLDHRGGRLSYMRNDLMYFGHSLQWQRSSPQAQAQRAPDLATRIAMLDARLQVRADRHYIALYFTQSRQPFESYQKWGEPALQGGFSFDVPATVQARVDQLLTYPSFDLPPGHVGQQQRRDETTAVVRRLHQTGALANLPRLAQGSTIAP